MNDADAAWRRELQKVTVADLMASMLQAASPKALEVGARWMQEVQR
jgi:hypothetical protein